ncbi:hypothetical protein IWQ60_002748 [Tieghemiomyces parasiticus]|uniref:Uncharacterized protein n=1 Tax=Tieghemiomyces parasiticus TaxID=78921 RepID=A0A9W8AGV5_9FUNG|nr:hypothetical protein IWQ60_002748 [Tieghemiomyces parasiticus]
MTGTASVSDAGSTANAQAQLRQRIREIMADSTIAANEKPRLIQRLMTPGGTENHRPAIDSSGGNSEGTGSLQNDETLPGAATAELTPTYSNGGNLGCEHYERGAKMWAACCRRWYTCRICHDEDQQTHTLDRLSIQVPAQHCADPACGQKLSKYYCDACHLWNSNPDAQIFHCDGCGICRMGAKEDFQHCTKCRCCISSDYWDQHRCREDTLSGDCPICGEFMFTSQLEMVFMSCGHPIHKDCLQRYMDTSFQCPICRKSLGDLSSLFRELDRLMAEQVMPPEYRDTLSEIFCNDCEKRSTTSYHFMYHKCHLCESYSTKVLRTFKQAQPTETAAAAPSNSDQGEQEEDDQ